MNLESNVYERVNEIVDGLRFRSFDKVYSSIKNANKNTLRWWLVERRKASRAESSCEKLMKNKNANKNTLRWWFVEMWKIDEK